MMLLEGAEAASLPPELERRAASRLRWLVLAIAVAFALTIPLRWILASDPALTLSDVVAATFAALGAITFLAMTFGRFSSAVQLQGGLLFEVVLCFALAMVEQVLIGFVPIPFRLSLVTVALLTFPLIVPSAPRPRLVATGVAAAMHPLAIVLVQLTMRGRLDVLALVSTSAPTLLVAGLSAWLGQLVHRLRIDASRAAHFGQYELVKQLGAGGMGEVWEARHTNLLRPAAVKIIRPATLGAYGSAARARFKREAQATAALASPHTVALYDFGATDDGTLYYAMELLHGIDLQTLVERFGPLPAPRVLRVLEQAARSLAEAHELGLVHRDIKPANLVLGRAGTELDFVKVLDFGLVKARFVSEDSPVSVAGAISGSPGYVAPEHLAGNELDGRADLYSLGCVAYFLLTGSKVFERPTRMALLTAHLTEDPVPPSRRSSLDVPPSVDALVLALLRRDPRERPASARALLATLRALREEVGRWDEDDAAAWWASHLPELVSPREALVL
jgi:serine/threonine-protein kinase